MKVFIWSTLDLLIISIIFRFRYITGIGEFIGFILAAVIGGGIITGIYYGIKGIKAGIYSAVPSNSGAGKVLGNSHANDFVSELRKCEKNVNGYADPEYIREMIRIKREYIDIRDRKQLCRLSIDNLIRELMQIQIRYERGSAPNEESIKLYNEYKEIKI